MQSARQWSLRSYFRAYALIFSILPCALMAAFISYYMSGRMHDLYMDDLRRTLLLRQQFLDTWIGDRSRDVVRLASMPELGADDLGPASRNFKRFVSIMPEFKALVFCDASGRTVLDTESEPGIQVGDREYFLQAKQGKPYISDLLVGRATGNRLIILSAPVKAPDGQFKGVLFATVTLDVIVQAVEAHSPENSGSTFLFDRKGALLAGVFHPFAGKEDSPPGRLPSFPEGSGTLSFTMKDGTAMEGAARTLGVTGWTIVAAVPKAVLSSTVRPVLVVVFAAGILSFLVVMPFVFRLARSIERVVEPLARHAEGLAHGNYGQAPPELEEARGPVELAVLAEAYETMRSRIIEDMRLLENMARTDDLTGLPNRRFLMEEGLRLIQLSQRAGKPCSCLMIDVDMFKNVNDRHGHAVGDAVLVNLARVLADNVRGADLAGRLGGEEFLVMCASTCREEAQILADRILHSVRNAKDGPLAELGITVSVGISTLYSFHDNWANLLDRLILSADMCMYQAKQDGRDRSVAATCDPGSPACVVPDE